MKKDWLIVNFAIHMHLQYIFRRSSTFCVYLYYNNRENTFHRAFSLTDLTEIELRKLKILKRPVFIILI